MSREPELYEMTRDRFGRFVKVARAQCLAGGGEDDDDAALAVAEDWREQLVDLDGVLETWEGLARPTEPALADWIREQRRDLRTYQDRLARLETRRHAAGYAESGAAEPAHEWIDSVNADAADLQSMEGNDRARLALRLVKWNGPGPVYVRRNGRTYFHPRIRVMDLRDDLVAAQPWAEDVRAAVLESGERIMPDLPALTRPARRRRAPKAASA